VNRSNIIITLFGFISGISVQINRIVNSGNFNELKTSDIVFYLSFGAIAISLILIWLRRLIRNVIAKSHLPLNVKNSYKRYDTYTYGVFSLPLLGAFGLQFTSQIVFLIIFSFLFFQLLLIYFLMNIEDKQKITLTPHWLSILFLLSGFAALIYQIVWQRVLFSIYGVNIESITIIVSIFMFGLGIGSIVGGQLSKKYLTYLPKLFLICEILIGLFGAVSLYLIKFIGNITLKGSIFSISISIYALLFFPTLLMGATLPILVTYLHRYLRNVGVSVGRLYSLNTLGSAIACFITVEFFFVLFGLQTTVFIAAMLNFIVGTLVYRYTQRVPQEKTLSEEVLTNPRTHTKKNAFKFLFILLLSAITGYVSLSQEILWIRAISYATGGRPDVFAYVLGFFLFGIAFGSLFATKICKTEKFSPLLFISSMLFTSSLIYYFSIPLGGNLLTYSEYGMSLFYIFIILCSFLTGGIFPLLCHFGIREATSVGVSLSWIYFANILGSTAGPLVTGFIFLNTIGLDKNILYLSIATLTISCFIFLISRHQLKIKTLLICLSILCIIIILNLHDKVFSQIFEKLHYKTEYINKKPYKYLIQNRAGIISVEQAKTDIIYGGGVYDGRFNIDPILNTNGIRRAYMIGALHPNPEEVLEIGLSSGSWTFAIASNKKVKSLSVIEINPDYVKIIKKYPDHSAILTNPKITIYIDDGRRWLNRNKDKKYDLIVMNTTFHWRSHATNLLSEEFLRICKEHLKPGGVIYYNTTWSEDVIFTAAKVFKYVTKYDSFIAVSDHPFSMSYEDRVKNLLEFENNGKPIFDQNNPELRHILHNMALSDLSDKAEEIRSKIGLLSITDDNMATEFKRINNKSKWQEVYNPEKSWSSLISQLLRTTTRHSSGLKSNFKI
jgi:spermidine synthase